MTLQERFKTEIPERVLKLLLETIDDYYTARGERDDEWSGQSLRRIIAVKDTITAFGFNYFETERVEDDISDYVLNSMRKNKTGIFSQKYLNSAFLDKEKTHD